MIYTKILALFVALLIVPQTLWATVHRVPHNVSTVVDLQDNDEISLVNFPVGWGYTRVVIGVNSIPGLRLSGYLVTNDCNHELHSSYEEIDFSYTGNEKVIYHGPAQRLPLQWWVDANLVLSSCKSYSELMRRDSIVAILYDFADSVYSEQIKDYKDLGKINSVTYFEGNSAKFKITDFPDWFYNRIYVQVEPMDGHELEGRAYVGDGKIEIKGFTEKIAIEQKTLLAPTFELAFPEYRKVKLKWWAEVGVPRESIIDSKIKNISTDSVEVEYSFGESIYSKNTVKLIFDKRKFSDGKIPVVKKLSFNPQGPNKSKDLGLRGNIYDFDAKLKPGDSAVIAIPLEFDYQPGKDSITIEHFIKEENRWIEHPVDSIVDNFAYIKVGHFSWLRSLCRGFVSVVVYAVPGTIVCAAVSESCHRAISGFIDGTANLIADGIVEVANGVKWVYGVLKGLVCGDLKKLMKLFGSSTSTKSDWDISQGSIERLSIMQKGDIFLRYLNDKRNNEPLVKLSDPYLDGECKIVDECRNNPFWPSIPIPTKKCKKMEEICGWNRTRNNLDIILADAILSQFDPENANTSLGLGVSKYKFRFDLVSGRAMFWNITNPNIRYDYDDYFMAGSELTEEAAWFVKGMESCVGAVNVTGMMIQSCIDWWDGLTSLSWPKTCNALFGFEDDVAEWISDLIDCPNFLINYKDILDGHGNKLIAASEVMARVSLLAWLKKADEFRNFTLLKYKAAYDGILAWIELAGSLMDYNNIAIKAYGGLALYEYIHYGDDGILKMLNGALNRHYGDNGGFSEGTGYSQYIWDDLTYVLAALKDAYKQKNETFEINGKFLKSPDYMFEFSRPVGGVGGNGLYEHYGLVPVEADDGVTYNPDYRVWAKLKDDSKYLGMSAKYPLKPSDGKINPLVAFGFPDISMYISNEQRMVPYRGNLWGDYKDGIGMITAVNGDDTVALSMIAENGKMWTRGQAHDQQDNLSITLTSSKKGFLIQDPGYSGFESRSDTDGFHRYYDHNVLVTEDAGVPLCGQDDNRKIPFDELRSRTYDFTGDFPGFGLDVLMGGFELFSSFDKNYSVEGGEPATVLDKKINEPQSGVVGFTATTIIKKPATIDKYDNNRTIMYFGGNFWVIDRPTNADGVFWMWLANSPMSKWDNMEKAGVRLYGSWDGKLTPSRSPENDDAARILQNGSRSDFIIDDGRNFLQNYKYTAFDKRTKTYVMTYSLDDETFDRDYANCPITAYQCFVNTAKNMRVVVPPSGTPFKLCDVLPKEECSGEAYSTGITMFAKTLLGEWTTRWVLDGDLWANENVFGFKIASATVSRTSYIYEKFDGTPVYGKHTGTYLPALPILLLR